MDDSQTISLTFTVLVVAVVLLQWLLGGLAAAIVVPLNSRRRSSEPSASSPSPSSDSMQVVAIVVVYSAAVVALIVGIVLGNVTGPAGPSFTCPSVFQWNGLGPFEQQVVSTFDGGGCTGHIVRMTITMVIVFVLAAAAAVIATVFGVARLMARRPAVQSSPAGWHPIAGQPGVLRWWDGIAWTDQYHDQNGPQP